MARRSWGSIKVQRSGMFQASYKGPDGKRHLAPMTFRTKGQAGRWLDREAGLIATGGWSPPDQRMRDEKAAEEAPTVAEAFEDWMTALSVAGRRDGTLRAYRSRFSLTILPVLGESRVRDVGRSDIRRWWSGLCDGTCPPNLVGGVVRPRTNGQTRTAYIALRSFWSWCVRNDLCEVSPVAIPEASVHRPVRAVVQDHVATPEQVRDLAAAMPDSLAVTVWLAAWCQLRQGEVLALRRGDVDLEDETIHVHASLFRPVGGGIASGPTKSDAGDRVISVPPRVMSILRDHLERFTGEGDDALVVSSPDGGFVHPSTFGRIWKRAWASCGLEGLTFHDLRHTGLTIFAQQGATVAELMHRGGHSSIEVALRYQHATAERDRALARLMDGSVVSP